jgi:hypothetical protein
MLDNLWLYAATGIGALYLAGPLVIRSAYRFAARCNPLEIPTNELPQEIAVHLVSRISEMQSLGFSLVGCYDCGELAIQTKTYVAYFCNRSTNDFANVTAMVSPRGITSYFEFSTRFTNGQAIETNTNHVLPLTPGNPDVRVFRFADIHEAKALFHMHRGLVEKYATGWWPQGEPKGQEIQRWVRTVENYGPRHTRLGYMTLSPDKESYRLTWKGAFLVAWRGLWPTSLLRKLHERQAMDMERQELDHQGIAALQKA